MPEGVLLAAVAALKAARSLRFSQGEFSKEERLALELEARETQISEDSHKGFFAYRRAEALAIADPSLLTDPTHAALIARVLKDFAEVDAFDQQQFTGPNSLTLDAPDGPTPPGPNGVFRCDPGKHLDLADVSKAVETDTEPNRKRLQEFRAFRRKAAKSIIWRAAAIETTLWNEQTTQPNKLRTDSFKELLDRRLRTVERMHAQVNGRAARSGYAIGAGNPRRSWVDGSRVRPVDYPDIHQPDALDLLGAPPEPFWHQVDRTGTYFTYGNDGNPTRLGAEPDQPPRDWLPFIFERYIRYFDSDGAKPLADAVNDLMQPALNHWDRAWLYCDHYCAAVHLDGLRFGMLRRNHSDNAFNDIPLAATVALIPATGTVPDSPSTINVDQLVGFLDDNILRGNNTWFNNMYIRPQSLQVGDHLIFWNHLVYLSLFPGAYRLENAFVTAVESDPLTGGIRPLQLKLEGHGMSSVERIRKPNGTFFEVGVPGLAAYAKSMRDELNLGLRQLRAAASDADGPFVYSRGGFKCAVLRWTPYPGITNGPTPGPWFLFIPRVRRFLDHLTNETYSSIRSMLRGVHHSVSDAPPAQRTPDYRPHPESVVIDNVTFDLTDGVFFPLYEPKVAGETKTLTWRQYFTRFFRDPTLRVQLAEYTLESPDPITLALEHDLDPELNAEVDELTGDIPGLFLAGQNLLPIQVVRAKVR